MKAMPSRAQRPVNGPKVNLEEPGEKEGPPEDGQINVALINIA